MGLSSRSLLSLGAAPSLTAYRVDICGPKGLPRLSLVKSLVLRLLVVPRVLAVRSDFRVLCSELLDEGSVGDLVSGFVGWQLEICCGVVIDRLWSVASALTTPLFRCWACRHCLQLVDGARAAIAASEHGRLNSAEEARHGYQTLSCQLSPRLRLTGEAALDISIY